MNLRWGASVLALAAVAGCGGYSGDDAPAPFPSSGPTASSGTPSPSASVEPPVTSSDADATPSPVASATPTVGEVISCTLRGGGPNALTLRVDDEVRDAVTTFRVQVLQGQNSRQVIFPAVRPSEKNKLGVTYIRTGYRIELTGPGLPMDAAWVPKAPASLTIEGRGPSDTVRFWRTRTIRFGLTYPNGERCPPEVFTFTIRLRPKDRV